MLGLIISAIVVGLIIGALGRLVLPGRQNISIWLTIAIGIVAALIGSLIASALGVGETSEVDWIKLIIQVALRRRRWPWSPAGPRLAVGASRLDADRRRGDGLERTGDRGHGGLLGQGEHPRGGQHRHLAAANRRGGVGPGHGVAEGGPKARLQRHGATPTPQRHG